MQAKKQVTDGSKQAEGYKEEVENSVAHVNQLESNACFFFFYFNFSRGHPIMV